MGRNIAAATAVAGTHDLKTLRVNQANGYANVSQYGSSNWHNFNTFWNNQFQNGANTSITISDATSHIKISTQVTVDHGDTWRSGMIGYAVYTGRNQSSGNTSWLGCCASSNYIQSQNTTGSIGFSQRIFEPAAFISGLQDGDTVYFQLYFRRQNGGGWNYINNMHTDTESASNGRMAKGGFKFDLEEVPAAVAASDWDPS